MKSGVSISFLFFVMNDLYTSIEVRRFQVIRMRFLILDSKFCVFWLECSSTRLQLCGSGCIVTIKTNINNDVKYVWILVLNSLRLIKLLIFMRFGLLKFISNGKVIMFKFDSVVVEIGLVHLFMYCGLEFPYIKLSPLLNKTTSFWRVW